MGLIVQRGIVGGNGRMMSHDLQVGGMPTHDHEYKV